MNFFFIIIKNNTTNFINKANQSTQKKVDQFVTIKYVTKKSKRKTKMSFT